MKLCLYCGERKEISEFDGNRCKSCMDRHKQHIREYSKLRRLRRPIIRDSGKPIERKERKDSGKPRRPTGRPVGIPLGTIYSSKHLEAITLFEKGARQSEIAKQLNVTKQMVSFWNIAWRKRTGRPPTRHLEAIAIFEKGMYQFEALAKQLHVSLGTIKDWHIAWRRSTGRPVGIRLFSPRRLEAIALFEKGIRQSEVVKQLHVINQTISKWHIAWRRKINEPETFDHG
jgi:transposase